MITYEDLQAEFINQRESLAAFDKEVNGSGEAGHRVLPEFLKRDYDTDGEAVLTWMMEYATSNIHSRMGSFAVITTEQMAQMVASAMVRAYMMGVDMSKKKEGSTT